MKIVLVVALFVCVQTQTVFAQAAPNLLERARASIQAGKAEAAVQDLTELLKTDTTNADAFATRAHAYIKLGNYAASLADSSRATAISPNFGWAYYLHGIASYWRTDKDFRGAMADFTKVIALDPQLAFEAYRFRADIHNQFDKDYWAAIADANEAIRLMPTDGNSYAQRGWANTQLKNYEKARDDYRMSIKNNFATSGVYTALGFNEFQLGDYDQAAIDSRRAIELDPSNQDAKNNLAGIIAAKEERTKRIDKAAAELFDENKRILFPDKKPAVQSTSGQKTNAEESPKLKDGDLVFADAGKIFKQEEQILHQEAQTLFSKGDYAGVLKYLDVKKIRAVDSISFETRAKANFQLKNYVDALEDLKTAISFAIPERASLFSLRGDIYKARYNYVMAEADYRKALALSPNDASIKERLNSLSAPVTAPKPPATATAAGTPKKPAALTPKEEDDFLKDDPSAKAAYNFWDIPSYEDVYSNASSSIKKKPTAKMYQLRAEAILHLQDEDAMLYDLDDAIKDINLAIEMSPRDLGEKYLVRGDIYVEMNDLAKALESYTKSIEADPNSFLPRLERGKIYLAKGFENWEKAVADLAKVIERDPTNSEAYDLRGYANFMLGKKADSAADFKKALAINPKDEYAKYNVTMLNTGERVLSMEEFKKHKKVYFV